MEVQSYSNAVSQGYLDTYLKGKGFTMEQFKMMPPKIQRSVKNIAELQEKKKIASESSATLESDIAAVRGQYSQTLRETEGDTKKTITKASIIAVSILALSIVTALIIRKKRLS